MACIICGQRIEEVFLGMSINGVRKKIGLCLACAVDYKLLKPASLTNNKDIDVLINTIDEIERRLSNYENHYILENQSLNEKLNLYAEKEKQYKEQILELYNKLDELNIINENNSKKNELNYKILKEENVQIKNDYNTLKNNFELVKKELNKEKTKNELLIDKYNKLSFLYEQREKDIKNNIYQKSKFNHSNITSYDNYKEQKDKILIYCNNTLSMFIKWIETNFINFNDIEENVNYNYDNYLNIDKNDLFIFDKLRDSLLQAKEIIDDYNYKLNIELKNEKDIIINIEKENEELNNFLENIYHHLYEEINKEKYFDINNYTNNNNENDKSFYFNEIEYLIENIFILLKKIKESSFNKSLDKLIEDNIILNKEIENCKIKIVDLFNDNKIILEKNTELQQINEQLKQQISNNFSNNNPNKNS